MSHPPGSTVSRKDFFILLGLFSLPFAGAFVLYVLSLTVLVKYAAFAVLAACFALLVFSYPKAGVLFGVFYIYASLSFYFRMHIGYPVISIAFLASLLGILRGDEIRLRNPLFNWSVAIFAMLALQSMLFSYSMHYSLLSYTTFAKVVILSFLLVQLFRNPRDLELLLLIIFLGSVASVLLGVANLKFGFARNLKIIGGVNMLRFSGTFENPNLFSIFLASAMPMGLYFVKRAAGAALKLLALAGVLILIIAAFATFSREAVFPIVFVLLAVLTREGRHNKLLFGSFLVAVVLLVVILVPAYYWDRLMSIGSLSPREKVDWSLYLRFKAMSVALDLFARHPFTGVGLRNFIVRSGNELFVRIGAHNVFLEILVGVGLFGFAALMAVYSTCLIECRRVMTAAIRDEDGRLKSLAFYIMVSFASTMIAAFFFSDAFSYSIWIPLASSLVLGNILDEHAEKTAR
jgi:O-antigen ligase